MDCKLFTLVVFLMLQSIRAKSLIDSELKNKREEMSLKTVLHVYQDEIKYLTQKITTLEDRVTKLETNNIEMDSNKDGLKDGGSTNDHAISKRSTYRRRRVRRPEVAFQATLTKQSATFDILDTIKFDKVITNIGGAYKKHSGVFIAPVAGTYTFNTNIVSERGHYVEASIVRNDEVTVTAISDHRVPKDGNQFTNWDQGNAVAILRLNKHDKVSVTVQWPQGSHPIHGIGKSSFSGSLLR